MQLCMASNFLVSLIATSLFVNSNTQYFIICKYIQTTNPQERLNLKVQKSSIQTILKS